MGVLRQNDALLWGEAESLESIRTKLRLAKV